LEDSVKRAILKADEPYSQVMKMFGGHYMWYVSNESEKCGFFSMLRRKEV
jgi:hypothetical protein